ncbi:Uncharacterised protein [Mycobacteroides abscessus subsp. abscessus]|nr:Uncharacterised protein [Mycobacteroides abscessus subsp. abscessus]
MAADRLIDGVERLVTEAQECRQLVGEAVHAVAEAMGEARRAEAAVASAGVLGDPIALDEHDPTSRIAFCRLYRGP